MTGRVLWTPPADVLETSRIGHYLAWLRRERGLDFTDYAEVYDWSVTDLPAFWRSIWDYFEVIAHTDPVDTLPVATMPGATWFPGATLNYAEHVLRMPGLADGDAAVLAYGQTRSPATLTAAQLRDEVRQVRAGLKSLGVAPGDRVAAYAPNIPETYVLMLATASLGAIFSSCAPEFGTRSVTDRWQQIEPKVLVAVDGYRYGDKVVDRRAEVAPNGRVHQNGVEQIDGKIWIPYPHVFFYIDRNGEWHTEEPQKAGQTLLWQKDQVTLRLEGDLTRERALEISAS